MERDWLLTSALCPVCKALAVPNFNTHPDTRKQAFWANDIQAVNCLSCKARLIRHGGYGVPEGQRAWKLMHDCPCGVARHVHNDVCTYF